MRKKAILLLLTALLLLFGLAACTKTYGVSKAGHDDIAEAGLDEYIAVEDGKYYLYGMDKKKSLSSGFDKLRYIDSVNTSYLLAYNDGDAGYSVIKNDGSALILSSKDVKITGAQLVYDRLYVENSKFLSYNFYGFILEYVNSEGFENSALYFLDGSKAHTAEACKAEVIKNTRSDGVLSIIYIFFDTYDGQGEIASHKVLNKNFDTVYEISYGKYKIFSSEQTFKTRIGCLAYTEKEFALTGEEVSSKVYYDIYCQDTAFTRFESVTSLYTGGNGAALFAKKGANYSLFNENGLVREFNLNSTVENNNIRVAAENGLYDIYKYDGTLLLDGVKPGNGNYLRQDGTLFNCYSYEGKELFTYNAEEITRTETKRFVTLNTVSEAVRLVDTQGKVFYKFFKDGVLVREYDTSFQYLSENNGVYIFKTLKDGAADYYYYFNVYGGTEFKLKANAAGEAAAAFNKVLEYKYYTEKNSKNINFYENAVETLTPYTGALVPGYARSGGYFSITHQSLSGLKQVVLKIEFDVYKVKRINDNEVYTDTKERWYAYYVITDTGKAANIEYVYSGLSKMTVEYNSGLKLICFSTIDRFAAAGLYTSFDKLDNKTLVYNVSKSEAGDVITLSKRAEIGKSNMSICNEDYLIGVDYKASNKNFVYTADGNKALDAKYYITEIKGVLAIINFVNSANQNSFGVYDLGKGKVVEKCDNYSVKLLGGGYYAIGKTGSAGLYYTIKNGKGKKIKDNVVSYDFIGESYNYAEGKKYLFYKINIGKNELKLFKITDNIA